MRLTFIVETGSGLFNRIFFVDFSGKGDWDKTEVEGTLFVYKREAEPLYGFTIMNRLNMDNLVEPVTKDLDFQLQTPFLLYRSEKNPSKFRIG